MAKQLWARNMVQSLSVTCEIPTMGLSNWCQRMGEAFMGSQEEELAHLRARAERCFSPQRAADRDPNHTVQSNPNSRGSRGLRATRVTTQTRRRCWT